MNDSLLILIRHGQTRFNLERRFQGQANPPLTEEGRMQARRAGYAVSGALRSYVSQGGSVVSTLTSDLLRAQESAEFVRTALLEDYNVDTLFTSTVALREYHCGDLEGLTYAEFEKMRPGVFQLYLNEYDKDPHNARFPGDFSESRRMVTARLQPLIESLSTLQAPGAHIWMTHGGVIDTLLEMLGVVAQAAERHVGNGSVLVLAPKSGGSKSFQILKRVSVL